MVFLGHWVNQRVIRTCCRREEVVELDWVVTRGGDKAATGRAGKLHARIDSHRVDWLCRVNRGVGF